MNEVEIVVKSTDKTDLDKIAAKGRTQLMTSMRKTYDDLDRETSQKFNQIGDHSGVAMGEGLKQGGRTGFAEAGQEAGLTFGDGFERQATGRLRDAKGRFVSEGKQLGEGLTAGVSKGVSDLGHDMDKGFSLAERAGRGFGNSLNKMTSNLEDLGGTGKLAVIGVVNSIALLPEIASVAGGAITLGLGGALVGLAMKSQMANKQVRQSFADTKHDIVSEFSDISKPFAGVMQDMSHEADVEFSNIAPSLEKAFGEMAPATDRFMAHFIASFSQLDPAIESLGHAFARVTDNLGPHMGDIMGNIATGIKAITDATAKNPQAITGMAEGIGKLIRYTGDGIGVLIRFKDQFEAAIMMASGGGPLGLFKAIDAMVSLKDKVMGTSHALQTGGGEFKSFADQAATGGVKLSALDKDMKTLGDDAASAADKANALSDAFNRLLNPAEAVFKDTANLKESIHAMGKALDDSKGKINDNSAAARASKQAFGGMIDNAKTLASDMLNSGKNIDQVRAALQPTIAQMYAFAGSNAKARALVDDFVHSLDGMPDNKKINLSMNAQDFFSKLHQAQGLKLDPKTGLLKGNNSDYLNKWLKANGLRIDPKTGLLKGNNADYYNKWLKANHLKIDPKTGIIKGNTAAFWKAVHSIPSSVGSRHVDIYAQMHLSGVQAALNKRKNILGYAHGGVVGHAAEGGPRSNLTMVGENGPELVSLPAGSSVRSNSDTTRMLSGGGGGSDRPIIVQLLLDGKVLAKQMITPMRGEIRDRGGRANNSVQRVLGGTI